MADDGTIRSGLAPLHPGELLRDVVLPALKDEGTTRIRFAGLLGLSRSRFYDLLEGKSAVTAELALKLGRLCGNGPDLWLELQQRWDLAKARAALGSGLDALPVLNTTPAVDVEPAAPVITEERLATAVAKAEASLAQAGRLIAEAEARLRSEAGRQLAQAEARMREEVEARLAGVARSPRFTESSEPVPSGRKRS